MKVVKFTCKILHLTQFCADSESVVYFRLKALFEFENRGIRPKMALVPVKTIFLNIGKKRKENDP